MILDYPEYNFRFFSHDLDYPDIYAYMEGSTGWIVSWRQFMFSFRKETWRIPERGWRKWPARGQQQSHHQAHTRADAEIAWGTWNHDERVARRPSDGPMAGLWARDREHPARRVFAVDDSGQCRHREKLPLDNDLSLVLGAQDQMQGSSADRSRCSQDIVMMYCYVCTLDSIHYQHVRTKKFFYEFQASLQPTWR